MFIQWWLVARRFSVEVQHKYVDCLSLQSGTSTNWRRPGCESAVDLSVRGVKLPQSEKILPVLMWYPLQLVAKIY